MCPPLERDTLASKIVDNVAQHWISEAPWTTQRLAPVKNVARQTLFWLSEADPADHLGTLAKLWPKILSSEDDDKDLTVVLELFGNFQTDQCVQLVETLLDRNPAAPKALRHQAMRWLASLYPRDAVRLWPKALFSNPSKQNPGTTAEDLSELLQLCDTAGLDPPDLPTKVSPAVLKALAESRLTQARLWAVRALQEMDLKGVDKGHAGTLNTLRTDSDTIVSASARLAWRSFFGGKDMPTSSEGGSDLADDAAQ